MGCGGHPAPAPWLNVDTYAGPGCTPDLVADVRSLPFPDGSVEAVYCGHVLEHLDRLVTLPAALAEVRRVLTPGGRLCVVGPDYDRAQANPEWHPLLSVIACGGDRWPGDQHMWTATGPATVEAMAGVFPDAREVDIATVDNFWPVVDRVGWQFAILA